LPDRAIALSEKAQETIDFHLKPTKETRYTSTYPSQLSLAHVTSFLTNPVPTPLKPASFYV
jgi:hypothetical protein